MNIDGEEIPFSFDWDQFPQLRGQGFRTVKTVAELATALERLPPDAQKDAAQTKPIVLINNDRTKIVLIKPPVEDRGPWDCETFEFE